MTSPDSGWPTLPIVSRLALALALGLFVGLERERRGKEAGLRTFAFTALVGALGGLLGAYFALLALALIGVLVVLLNIETARRGDGAEITTTAALLVMGFTGVIAGQGHTFTPTALAVVTAALLAWKEPMTGFTRALTDRELRSAILLAILAFVIFPVLPRGSVDRWSLVEPRAAWITVILIAALGFANYVLLKMYGARGMSLTGFLGGLVNSTVAVTELAHRVRASGAAYADLAFQGVALATAAMLVRNAVLLGLLAPAVMLVALPALVPMLVGALVFARRRTPVAADAPAEGHGTAGLPAPMPGFASPFSLSAALRYGAIFLALQVAGTLAQRALGQAGFYAVNVVGGFVSSASAVAAAANMANAGTIPLRVAALGAVLAAATSAAVNLPLVARIGGEPRLTRRVARALAVVLVLGALGAVIMTFVPGVPLG
jgi:uncharacterized membrane protein (DUF4010 family)